MANAKYTLYKYVKLASGWRYCRAAFHSNGKIKSDVVLVSGKEEKHSRGQYYLNYNNEWMPVGTDAVAAQQERAKLLSRDEYLRLGGRVEQSNMPAPVAARKPLQHEADEYLSEIARKVRSGNKRQGSYDLMACTLKKFIEQSKLKYLDQIAPKHLDDYGAWVKEENSPTHSDVTARNEWLRVWQFTRNRGVTLTMKDGNRDVPLTTKHAPKVTIGAKVVINSNEDVAKFFQHCTCRKQRTCFYAFQRAGLREMELATLRWIDIVLDGNAPCLVVDDRDADGYQFRPKWYARRRVSIDPDLIEALRKWKGEAPHHGEYDLAFGTRGNKINWHLLRDCKRIAERSGFKAKNWKLHRFRANFATHCLPEWHGLRNPAGSDGSP